MEPTSVPGAMSRKVSPLVKPIRMDGALLIASASQPSCLASLAVVMTPKPHRPFPLAEQDTSTHLRQLSLAWALPRSRPYHQGWHVRQRRRPRGHMPPNMVTTRTVITFTGREPPCLHSGNVLHTCLRTCTYDCVARYNNTWY